MYYNRAVRIDS